MSADANNILFLGVSNPLSIAIENIPAKDVVVKVVNGSITGENGKYLFRGESEGRAEIILFKKQKEKIVEIARSAFRVKRIPDPVPKIGPSGGGIIEKVVLAAQQYLRADYDYWGFDAKAKVDSFTVSIIRGDSCLYREFKNVSAKISPEISGAFQNLHDGDTVIFKNIYAQGPDGKSVMLIPFMLFIKE